MLKSYDQERESCQCVLDVVHWRSLCRLSGFSEIEFSSHSSLIEHLRIGTMQDILFNVDSGYLEGLVRGFKSGILRQADYLNLVQCETLEGECEPPRLFVAAGCTPPRQVFFSSMVSRSELHLIRYTVRDSRFDVGPSSVKTELPYPG